MTTISVSEFINLAKTDGIPKKSIFYCMYRWHTFNNNKSWGCHFERRVSTIFEGFTHLLCSVLRYDLGCRFR